MFGLLGLWSHFRMRNRIFAASFFVLAMISKPSAITFPAMVFLVERILLGNSLRKSLTMPALYGVLLLPFALVTKYLQPDSMLDFIPTIPQRLIVAADAFGFYLQKVLLPFPLTVDYGRSPHYVLEHVRFGWIALSFVLLLTGGFLVAKSLGWPRAYSPDGEWRKFVSCGWGIFFVSLFPMLGLVPFGFQDISTVADHYLYVPILGVGVMVAGVMMRFRLSPQVLRLGSVVLVIFVPLSFQQARLWRSTESLFTHTMNINPRSYLAPYCIAGEHLHAGRFEESRDWLRRSLAKNPDNLDAVLDLGIALGQAGDPMGAIDHYAAALARNPSTIGTRARTVSSIHNNLGMLLARVGRGPEAVEHFHKAVAIFPRSVNGHLNLGNIAFDEQRYQDAIAEYEVAKSLNPGNPTVEMRLEKARHAHAAISR